MSQHQTPGLWEKDCEKPDFRRVCSLKTAKKKTVWGGYERSRTRACNQWLKRVLVMACCLQPRACYATRVRWTTGQTSLLELIFKVSNRFLLTDFQTSFLRNYRRKHRNTNLYQLFYSILANAQITGKK